jgi:hypothetical protein
MALKLGMSKQEVEDTLGLVPYDLKAITDSTNVFIYVYRTKERKTLSFVTTNKNGINAKGKYVQLAVAFSKKTEKVVYIETCSLCPDNLVTNSVIDVEKIFVFVTVTLPVVLLYFGLKK